MKSIELNAPPGDGATRWPGQFQLMVFLLCAFVALVDGFDTQVIALAAPSIAAHWNLAPSEFGRVFASGLVGALFGAIVFGVGADRFGRKPSLVVAILLFGLVSLLTPFCRNLGELTIVRLITGVGLGGALPGVIAVTSEFAAPQRRAAIVSLMFCGFPLGAVMGGVIAAFVIPAHGWEPLFYIGGVAPLLLLPAFAAFVPESVRFLLARGERKKADAIVQKMRATQLSFEDGPGSDGPKNAETPWALLRGVFGEGRAVGSAILTVTFMLSLMLSYFLVNWLPLLSRQAGAGARYAVLGVAALNLGAIGGCLVIGKLINRHGALLPITLAYTIGGGVIALIGVSGSSGGLLLGACFLAGAFSIGAQMCIVGLAATFYETSVRATGVGWLMGTGRIGAIFGPIFGGLLISYAVPAPNLFLVAGGVSFCAAVGVFLLGFTGYRERTRFAG
ncbi:MAG: MFS transporter [Pseudomonadota bacterium]|nr:MFS transporter [Pseudomonadota bacterium]